MKWIHIQPKVIRDPAYIQSSPVVRATWFSLVMYTAEHGSAALINVASWTSTQWYMACGVSKEEVLTRSELWEWKDGSVTLKLMPNNGEDPFFINWQAAQMRRNKANRFISQRWVRDAVFAKLGRACVCCSSTYKLALDHIVPVSRGGEDSIENLQPLCTPCNSAKGSKIQHL